jgi:hypothetical protein
MWKLFKRRRRQWLTFDEFYQERQRLKREDPKEYEEEQRRAREWALRLLDSKKRNNEKESTGQARGKSGF